MILATFGFPQQEPFPSSWHLLFAIVKGMEQEGFVAVTLPNGYDMRVIKIVIRGAYALLSAMKNVEE